MTKSYFFHDGDFFKWYKAYLECKLFINDYRYQFSSEKKSIERFKYKEAKGIIEEYRILMCSLDDNDKKYLLDSIKQGFFNESELRFHFDIILNWEVIVLNSHKHDLNEINLIEFGKKLKKLRIEKGFTRVDVSKFLTISERTLKSYEDGNREIGVKSLYKLIQLYGGRGKF